MEQTTTLQRKALCELMEKKEKERKELKVVERKVYEEKQSAEEEITRTKLSSRDYTSGNDSDEYVLESIGVMTQIFLKPQPPSNTTTSQNPPTEPTTSSSNSTNQPFKEHKSTTRSLYSSANLKILEAKVDLILDHLAKPHSAPIPPVAPSITFEDHGQKNGAFLNTVDINTGVDALSKNFIESFLNVFSKIDEMKSRFVNEVVSSFTKGGEETNNSPKDDDEKKIPEGAIIQNLYDDENSSKKHHTPLMSPPKNPSPPKSHPKSSPPKSPPKAPTLPIDLGNQKLLKNLF
ncbi:unnamed protein product [Lactuca virosa]|uniref:Uncharacterized protein n=1 Tax=Lactuca virosa TaxID=75947 RepID=A0AAU9MYS2_9ASTR|nr:unnamed protein product [Lactuca virosa]